MMSQSQYSLTWEAHVRNVCDGLSSLQQNGEFVDMTLAADGHMVKVHQVVLALSSPYLKDLIRTAECPHPVIFLNKVSFATLSTILEYMYTGEVLVSLEHLNDLVEAAKALHIKGLKDMKVSPALMETSKGMSDPPSADLLEDNELCLFQEAPEENNEINGDEQQQEDGISNIMQYTTQSEYDEEQLCDTGMGEEEPIEPFMEEEQVAQTDIQVEEAYTVQDESRSDSIMENESVTESNEIQDEIQNETDEDMPLDTEVINDIAKLKAEIKNSVVQYTVSNQGSLQMILNRFVYYLKHTNRDNSRQWRCVDYLSHTAKCPAHVVTKDDIVLQRIDVHTHPFHDKRILKKLKNGSIFSAIMSAERERNLKKKKNDDHILDSENSRS